MPAARSHARSATVARTAAAFALIVLLTLIAHAPSLVNGFVWDDPDNVTENVHLRTLDGLYRIWTEPTAIQQYYPLVHSTFWVEYQLWQLQPFRFHLHNILLHALGAVLLWRCLLRLELPGALMAACVFALHPVQVESVAWITERKNVLCGVFYFGAALVLLPLFVSARDSVPAGSGAARRYAGGVALFVLAMLSKTVACSLGAVLLLIAWWKTGSVRKRELLLAAPLLAIGAGLGALTAWLEREHVGAEGREWAFTFADRCIIAGRSLVFYVQSLLWPAERVFMPARWEIDDRDPVQYLYPLAVLLLLAGLWHWRTRLGRGPLVAALIYVGVLFPALGFFNVYAMRYGFAFDHFQYLAVPAPVAAVCAAAGHGLRRVGKRWQLYAAAGCSLLLLVYAGLTFQQSRFYFSEGTLWRHTLEHNPGAWLAHRHLGKIALDQHKPGDAVRHFLEAARLRPSDEAAFNNLAIAYSLLGRYDQAVRALRRSVQLQPGFAPTYKNLATALALDGRADEARAVLAQYQRMTAAAPTPPHPSSPAGTAPN